LLTRLDGLAIEARTRSHLPLAIPPFAEMTVDLGRGIDPDHDI
jgi:hypothetical protein